MVASWLKRMVNLLWHGTGSRGGQANVPRLLLWHTNSLLLQNISSLKAVVPLSGSYLAIPDSTNISSDVCLITWWPPGPATVRQATYSVTQLPDQTVLKNFSLEREWHSLWWVHPILLGRSQGQALLPPKLEEFWSSTIVGVPCTRLLKVQSCLGYRTLYWKMWIWDVDLCLLMYDPDRSIDSFQLVLIWRV